MKILFILLFILNAFSIVAQKKKTYFDKATTIEVTSGSGTTLQSGRTESKR